MPLKAMKMGAKYALIGTLMTLSTLATVGMAQIDETREVLTGVADKYGLWAACTVGLVIFTVWMFWRESTTNRQALMNVIERSIRSNDSMTDSMTALRDEFRLRPCMKDFDSDRFAEAVARVRDRREAKEERESTGD